MRRIVLILGICMAFLASCSSSGPTGDPKNDAKQFAKEMFSAFNSENVEKMADVINTYYEFYKDKKGRCLRPVQDCREGYGKGVLLYQVQFDGRAFRERMVNKYENSKLVIDGKSGVDFFHTYSRTSEFEVIDYIYNRFDLFKEIKWQIRKFKRYRRAKDRLLPNK